MDAQRRTATRIGLVFVVCLPLGGCGLWNSTPEPYELHQSNHPGIVLAELGIFAPPAALTTPPRSGPCLVAGDRIAWSWAIAHGTVSPARHDAWRYAGAFTD